MGGWLDLWRGIIVNNILEEDIFIYFISPSKLEHNLARESEPKPVWDITCYKPTPVLPSCVRWSMFIEGC
jgi:hypothetical protein